MSISATFVRQVRTRRFVDILSIVLALVIVATCWRLYEENRAYDAHLVLMQEQKFREFPELQNFSNSGGPTFYEFLAYKYELIIIFMIVFLIAKFLAFQKLLTNWALGKISRITYFVSLFLALYQFWQLFYEKALRRDNLGSWNDPDNLMRSAIPWDWLCLVILSILLVLQVLSLFLKRNSAHDF